MKKRKIVNRFVFLGIFLIFPFVGFSQYTIIQTGRPQNELTRNIKEIAAKQFKIQYQYIAFNGNPEQIDSINTANKIVYQKLEKKYGNDWKEQLKRQENEEQSNISLFRSLLFKDKKATAQQLIIYEKSKCGKKYTATIYPEKDIPIENQKSVLRKFRMKLSDGKAVIY